MDRRICSNCKTNRVDELRQTFTYRDYMGNKCDSCISPLCDECIDAGEYKDENNTKRLYVGNRRTKQY